MDRDGITNIAHCIKYTSKGAGFRKLMQVQQTKHFGKNQWGSNMWFSNGRIQSAGAAILKDKLSLNTDYGKTNCRRVILVGFFGT